MKKQFGWFLAVKAISEYTGVDYYSLLAKPAIDVFGMVRIIEADNLLKQNQNNIKHG